MSEIRLEVIDNVKFQVRLMAFAINNEIMIRIELPSMVQSTHNLYSLLPLPNVHPRM